VHTEEAKESPKPKGHEGQMKLKLKVSKDGAMKQSRDRPAFLSNNIPQIHVPSMIERGRDLSRGPLPSELIDQRGRTHSASLSPVDPIRVVKGGPLIDLPSRNFTGTGLFNSQYDVRSPKAIIPANAPFWTLIFDPSVGHLQQDLSKFVGGNFIKHEIFSFENVPRKLNGQIIVLFMDVEKRKFDNDYIRFVTEADRHFGRRFIVVKVSDSSTLQTVLLPMDERRQHSSVYSNKIGSQEGGVENRLNRLEFDRIIQFIVSNHSSLRI